MRALKLTAAAAAFLALAACAAGTPEAAHAASGGLLSQFVLGLWHGMIAPVTLIVEIINRLAPHLLPWKVHLFETKGTDVAYDLGFYLGLVGSPVLAWGGWSRRRRR